MRAYRPLLYFLGLGNYILDFERSLNVLWTFQAWNRKGGGRFGHRSLKPHVRFGVVGLVWARDVFSGSRGPDGRIFFDGRNFLRCGNFPT